MVVDAKLKLKAFLAVFRDWVMAWLSTSPDRELLQLAHAQVGHIYAEIGKRLKDG